MRREILIIQLADPGGAWSLDSAQVPLGSVSEVKAALAGAFGEGTWHVPDQGVFDGEGFSLLAKISIFDPVENMTLEMWGEADPAPQVQMLCAPRGWQAVDLDSFRFISRPQG